VYNFGAVGGAEQGFQFSGGRLVSYGDYSGSELLYLFGKRVHIVAFGKPDNAEAFFMPADDIKGAEAD